MPRVLRDGVRVRDNYLVDLSYDFIPYIPILTPLLYIAYGFVFNNMRFRRSWFLNYKQK